MAWREESIQRRKEAGILRDKFHNMSVPVLKGLRTKRVNRLISEWKSGLPAAEIADRHLEFIKMAEVVLSNKGVNVEKLRPKCPRYTPRPNW